MDEFAFDEERKRVQEALNQAKKKELAEKYGAHFSDESQLSPDGESKWLNYIEEFERQFEHANRIKIREFVGNPAFTALAKVPAGQLESEVESVLDFLSLHNINVSCLAEVSNEALYRFLTIELMDEDTDDIRIEGMTHNFIYEEFHPNDEYDAKSAAEEFLSNLFGRQEEWVLNGFAKDEMYDTLGIRTTPEQMGNLIRSFYARYAAFTNHAYECIECTLNGDYATVRLQGEWAGLKAGSLETVSLKGLYESKMKKSPYGGYDLIQVNFPGFMT